MLTFVGGKLSCCDEIPRRLFLKAGALGLGGLTLPQLVRTRAEAAQNGEGVRNTSVIYLELAGGPSQFETYDPKPEAPAEIRGPLGFVRTNVPGVWFSELMSQQAKVMDRLAIVRSISHERNSHDPSSHLVQTGYYKSGPKGGPNEFPCIGSITAKVRGPNRTGVPAYVAIPKTMRNGAAAYLGNAYDPFQVGSNPNDSDFRVKNLSLTSGLDARRLEDRRALLASMDAARRVIDNHGVADALDRFTRQAFDLVTGERAQQAFDIDREQPRIRDRYGRTTVGQGMLLARRLVEAGVTLVTVRVVGWDDHQRIEDRMRKKGPAYDQAVAALVTDLYDRGLDRDVLVVAIGEFGRTPRVNRDAGRDHWGKVMSVLFSGGGLRMGQVVGASDRNGEAPIEAPYRPENVLATVYRHLGIDPALTFNDHTGRPRYLLERREIINELI